MSNNNSYYDIDKDGTLSKEDLDIAERRLDLNLREEKAEFRNKLAIVSFVIATFITVLCFSPFIPLNRMDAVLPLIITYVAGAFSLVGAVIGLNTWMHKG